jgi:hypothetical protein
VSGLPAASRRNHGGGGEHGDDEMCGLQTLATRGGRAWEARIKMVMTDEQITISAAEYEFLREVEDAAQTFLTEYDGPGVSLSARNNLVSALDVLAEADETGWDGWGAKRSIAALVKEEAAARAAKDEALNQLATLEEQIVALSHQLHQALERMV